MAESRSKETSKNAPAVFGLSMIAEFLHKVVMVKRDRSGQSRLYVEEKADVLDEGCMGIGVEGEVF